jgi:hypothetical protein
MDGCLRFVGAIVETAGIRRKALLAKRAFAKRESGGG